MTHKVITAIYVDLETNPLGLPSRLAHDLAGKPILRHTVERALAIDAVSSTHILCHASQRSAVADLLEGLPVTLDTHQAPPPPYRELVRSSRSWGLDSWRGGVGSLCTFDEDCHVELLAALQQKTNADSILTIPAAAPLIDPVLCGALIAHHRESIQASELTIVQAPPGLNAMVMSANTIQQLRQIAMPPGALLVYQPDSPVADLTGREGCYRPATEIVHASGRLLADTQRSWKRIERIVEADGLNWDAAQIARWLIDDETTRIDDVPREIEIELTTDCQFATDDRAFPRGEYVPSRGPFPVSALESVLSICRRYDDVRVMLGGFGEPTLHPHFADICRQLRDAGALAIGIRSNGLAIPGAVETALFETPVDVIEITLDAATPETYQRMHGRDGFETVVSTMERLMQRRRDLQSVRPLIVPSMVKCAETLDDVEPFVDRWQRAFGMYALRGISDYGGNWHPDRAVRFSTAPGNCTGCRRTRTRLMILADGTVTTCDQDFAGKQELGNLRNADIEKWWQSNALGNTRIGEFSSLLLCQNCQEWHRP